MKVQEKVGTVRGCGGAKIVVKRTDDVALLYCEDDDGNDGRKYTLLYLTPKALTKLKRLLR